MADDSAGSSDLDVADREATTRPVTRALNAVLPPQYRRRSRSASPVLDAAALTQRDIATQLDRLGLLLEAGMITDQEHAAQKAALFDRER